jgi:hypothetical protein
VERQQHHAVRVAGRVVVVAILRLKHGKQQRPLLPRTLTDRQYKRNQIKPHGSKQPAMLRKPQMLEWLLKLGMPKLKRHESKRPEKPGTPKWLPSKPLGKLRIGRHGKQRIEMLRIERRGKLRIELPQKKRRRTQEKRRCNVSPQRKKLQMPKLQDSLSRNQRRKQPLPLLFPHWASSHHHLMPRPLLRRLLPQLPQKLPLNPLLRHPSR